MTLERPITVDRYVRKSTGEVVKSQLELQCQKPGDVVKLELNYQQVQLSLVHGNLLTQKMITSQISFLQH